MQRRQRNKIERLKNLEGEWISGEDNLSRLVGNHFGDLFSSEPGRRIEPIVETVSPKVSDRMNAELTKPVSREEVRKAAFQLGARKSPGPDGFSGMFYREFWPTLGDEIFKGVHEFFASGFLLKEVNRTDMVLIPKIPSPEEMGHLRPISCCNYTYKIISKIMANRLKPFLGDIISANQSAFLAGRQIQDNILVAQEVFHHLKQRRRGKIFEVAVKLDMNKAYDRLE